MAFLNADEITSSMQNMLELTKKVLFARDNFATFLISHIEGDALAVNVINKLKTAEKIKNFIKFVDAIFPIFFVPQENKQKAAKRIEILKSSCRLALRDLHDKTLQISLVGKNTLQESERLNREDLVACMRKISEFLDDTPLFEFNNYFKSQDRNVLLSRLRKFQIFIDAYEQVIDEPKHKEKIERVREHTFLMIEDADTIRQNRDLLTELPDEIFGSVMNYVDYERALALYIGFNKSINAFLACPEKLGQYLSERIIRGDVVAFLDRFPKRCYPAIPLKLTLSSIEKNTPEILQKIQEKFPKLVEITYTGSSEHFLSILPHLPNVTSICVSKFELGTSDFAYSVPRTLEKLTITYGVSLRAILDKLDAILTNRCPNLKEMRLVNMVDNMGLPSTLSFPPSLHLLDLSNNTLQSPQTLRQLLQACQTPITSLILNGCKIGTLGTTAFVQDLPSSLQVLQLKAPPLSTKYAFLDCPARTLTQLFTTCPNLRELDLSDHEELTLQDFCTISFPATMERLTLQSCSIDMQGVKKILESCPNLTYLDLSRCPNIPEDLRHGPFSKIRDWCRTIKP